MKKKGAPSTQFIGSLSIPQHVLFTIQWTPWWNLDTSWQELRLYWFNQSLFLLNSPNKERFLLAVHTEIDKWISLCRKTFSVQKLIIFSNVYVLPNYFIVQTEQAGNRGRSEKGWSNDSWHRIYGGMKMCSRGICPEQSPTVEWPKKITTLQYVVPCNRCSNNSQNFKGAVTKNSSIIRSRRNGAV